MHTIANLEKDGMVRLFVGSSVAGEVTVIDEPAYRRCTAKMTRRQAIALAYRLLHAANDEGKTDSDDVAPSSQLRRAT